MRPMPRLSTRQDPRATPTIQLPPGIKKSHGREHLFLTNGSPILRAELDIIDAHAFPDSVSLWHEMRNHHDGTLAGLLTSMDAAGIRPAILCSVATKSTQVEKITNWSGRTEFLRRTGVRIDWKGPSLWLSQRGLRLQVLKSTCVSGWPGSCCS